MTLSKKLLMLAAALAFSFSAVACDDDSDDNKTPEVNPGTTDPGNTDPGNTDPGNTDPGNTDPGNTDPGNTNPSTPTACTTGTFRCNGSSLQKCNDKQKWSQLEDCGTKECDAENGICIAECDSETFGTQCTDGGRVENCVNGTIVRRSCDVGKTCKSDSTKEDKCENDTSVVVNANTVVGTPCKCTGEDCKIVLSVGDLKQAINFDAQVSDSTITLILSLVKGLVDKNLKDTDTITAPNYFSESIKGSGENQCNFAAGDIPEGMTVGCFETATIDVSSLKPVVDAVIPLLNQYGSLISGIAGDLDVNALVEDLSSLITSGIKFTQNGGYCLTAAIDVDIAVTSDDINAIVNMNNVNNILNKINTGDHSKAKNAVCPSGSSLISFTIDCETDPGACTEGTGAANVGFDVCLRNCVKQENTSDSADCYDNNSQCIEIESDTGKKNVCLSEENIKYFTNLTNKFSGIAGVISK